MSGFDHCREMINDVAHISSQESFNTSQTQENPQRIRWGVSYFLIISGHI
jgi:hypothetical protein